MRSAASKSAGVLRSEWEEDVDGRGGVASMAECCYLLYVAAEEMFTKNTITPPRISSSHLHHKTAMASVFSTATVAHSSHTTAPLHQGFPPCHPVQSNHRHIVRPPQHNHLHLLTHHRSADAAKYIKKYKYIEAVCLLWHPHPSCPPDPSC